MGRVASEVKLAFCVLWEAEWVSTLQTAQRSEALLGQPERLFTFIVVRHLSGDGSVAEQHASDKPYSIKFCDARLVF